MSIQSAKAGDERAFGELVKPFERELRVHCYRMLGSLQDAEDLLQETLLAAWRGLGAFEERASLRTWLYRVATSRCLDALRSARRHTRPATAADTGSAGGSLFVNDIRRLQHGRQRPRHAARRHPALS